MSLAPTSPPGLLQQRPFVLFWLARLASTMGYQMLALVIAWQSTSSPTARSISAWSG